jgi:hypothetical protein
MTKLFRRDWLLQLGNISITPDVGLRLNFSVEKDNKRTPNKAKVRVWNLGRERRESIPQDVEIQLRAGYEDLISTIFLGQAKRVISLRENVDIILDIEAQDSGASYRDAQVSRSFGDNTLVLDVALYIVEQLGIGEGNLRSVTLTLANNLTTYANGTTLYGSARQALDRIIRAAGYRWSIQDGALQVRSGSNPVDLSAILLRPGTGLIGSPSKTSDGKVRVTIKDE